MTVTVGTVMTVAVVAFKVVSVTEVTVLGGTPTPGGSPD